MFSFTIRGALFGATIFGSSELGLWKDGETSREVAKLIIAILTPIANKAKTEMPEQVFIIYYYVLTKINLYLVYYNFGYYLHLLTKYN